MKIETTFEQLFFLTILIESIDKNNNRSFGTGFIIHVKNAYSKELFLVTNKHVIKDANSGILRFHMSEKGNKKNGQGYKLNIPEMENYWIGHSNPDIDVAVMSMSVVLNHAKKKGVELFFTSISNDIFPSIKQLNQFDAVEEIIFVGYPNGIYDQANYLPVIRRGFVASPLQIDYENNPLFLIDASIFPGSSGSPVFLFNKGSYHPREGGVILGNRLYFLGIISSGYFNENIMEKKLSKLCKVIEYKNTYKQMINLGCVFKSNVILEIISKLK